MRRHSVIASASAGGNRNTIPFRASYDGDTTTPALQTRRRMLGGTAAAIGYIVAAPLIAACSMTRNSTAVEREYINMPGFISSHPRAQALIRIGDQAITQRNDAMLRAYFAEDYVFHGPAGDLTFDELSAYFASLREAFNGFRLVREQIIVEGDYLAARNTFSGTFARVFTQSPSGPLQPTGRYVEWEAINTFRYDADERLAEEWVQTDYRSMLVKLEAEGPPEN